MTDQPLTGVALMSAEPPTWLRTASARLTDPDRAAFRDAVDAARAAGRDLPPGARIDVLVVWGRPGKRALPEALTVAPADLDRLRSLLLELDR